MNPHWKQFSLYPLNCRNRFQPLQVLHKFLPDFIAANPAISLWHVLFEPSALVRFQAERDTYNAILASADTIANACGLILELGDCSSSLNPELAYPSEDYYDTCEILFYGKDLWQANVHFLQACSELSLQISRLDHQKQIVMMRKHQHLLCNIFGLNFLEEYGISHFWANAATERYKSHGRS